MKTNYLLPHSLKKIGWILFIPGLILGLVYFIEESEPEILNVNVFYIARGEAFFSDEKEQLMFGVEENNILDEVIGVLLIVGGLLIALSKEKNEDELISKIRLESLVWATYINYAVLLVAIIFIYEITFFWVLVFNMFTILIFFIILFNRALYKSRKQIQDEE